MRLQKFLFQTDSLKFLLQSMIICLLYESCLSQKIHYKEFAMSSLSSFFSDNIKILKNDFLKFKKYCFRKPLIFDKTPRQSLVQNWTIIIVNSIKIFGQQWSSIIQRLSHEMIKENLQFRTFNLQTRNH